MEGHWIGRMMFEKSDNMISLSMHQHNWEITEHNMK